MKTSPLRRIAPVRSLWTAAAIIAATINAQPQTGGVPPIYEFEEIVVTASRAPVTVSDLARSVFILQRADIEQLPAHSLQELLQTIHGVDVRQRGPFGIQADVGIRGGTFEQTLVLIDGVRVNDPQTGHHTMNIPLHVNDIERIEVLKGAGSRLFGPNAFDGVINIITRRDEQPRLSAGGLYGDHHLWELNASGSARYGGIGHSVSVAGRQSDGYMHNTDFNMFMASYRAAYNRVHLHTGYIDKAFGANGFYSDAFPDQYEHTKTLFINAAGDWMLGSVSLAPKLSWRMNDDDFMLVRDNPGFYRNLHTTHVYGGELQASHLWGYGLTTVGGEIGRDEIESTNLGTHARTRGGIFVEHQVRPAERLTVVAGGYVSWYSDWGWDFWPGVDIGYQVTQTTRLFGSVGKAFRVPSYTELYYQDPANIGNPSLVPEEAWTYEIGAAARWHGSELSSSVFLRDGASLIDWVRPSADQPWQARNFTSVTTYGIEASAAVRFRDFLRTAPIRRAAVSYAFTESDLDAGAFVSGYVLDHFRHQIVADLSHDLLAGIHNTIVLRYEERKGRKGHILADLRLLRPIGRATATLEVTNLFNTVYSDVRSVPLPGRWLAAGIRLTLL
jgi:vitamin B12 transporter